MAVAGVEFLFASEGCFCRASVLRCCETLACPRCGIDASGISEYRISSHFVQEEAHERIVPLVIDFITLT